MVVIVDDLPWIDAPTRRTLAYIARRLQFERVAIMSARRAGADSQSDTGPTYVIDAVDDDGRRPHPRRGRGRQRRGPPPARRRRRRNPLGARRGGEPDRRRSAGRAHRAARSAADRVVGPAGRRPRVRPASPARARPPCSSPPRSPTAISDESGAPSPRKDSASPSWRPRRNEGVVQPRRRSAHVPAPADALGGVPRCAPRRPAGRPSGARGHPPGRIPDPGVAPGRAAVGPDEDVARCLDDAAAVTGPTGCADGRRPHVGAGQPTVARPDRPGPAARCWPPVASSTRGWRGRPAVSSTVPTRCSKTTRPPTT